MKEIVILDLDGVIVKGQSQQIFLKYLFKKKIVGLFFYLKINLWFLLYKLGLIKDPKNIMNYSFSFFKEKTVDEIESLIDDFFDNDLKKFIFSEMIDIINEHKLKNREILIISNAVNVLVKKIANFVNIEKYIATELEIINEKFTGNILGDIVYGTNKPKLLKKFIEKNNLDLKNSWAYTDHISDIGLLNLSPRPCAVNPDKSLFKEAKRKNWPILMLK
jgi:HAD superfamily hydrolase (TIGR01490 family)